MQTESSASTLPPDAVDPDPEFFHLVWEKVRSKGMKYSLVSVVNVLFGGGLLAIFVGPLDLGATKSNVMAVGLSAVPAYYLNRAWVWQRRGRSDFRREVLPFWIFVVVGLVMSTVSVTVAAHRFPESNIVPNVANLGAFGILWVLRFFVLDRLFHKPHADIYEVAEEVVEHIDHGEALGEALGEVAHEHEHEHEHERGHEHDALPG